MANSIEGITQNKSSMHANDLGILQKLSQIKSKHRFLPLEDTLGNYQVLADVPHLLAEVWSCRPHSKAKSGKTGFPSWQHEEHEHEEHEEHEHEENECKDQNLL